MPPETVRSSAAKVVDGSESVKVRVAVSPAFSELTSELTAIVGAAVSLLEASVACVPELPARSSTSAVMVRVPSFREERSRPVTE